MKPFQKMMALKRHIIATAEQEGVQIDFPKFESWATADDERQKFYDWSLSHPGIIEKAKELEIEKIAKDQLFCCSKYALNAIIKRGAIDKDSK